MRTFILVLLVCVVVSRPLQAAPSFAKDPIVTEFDIDPNWPKYPNHIEQKGWVSGMAIDQQQQIWMFKKGPDPVQVYRTDGTFVRSWGKGLFKSPHQLRIGPDGAIWVADFDQHVIQRFTPEGKLLQTVGTLNESGEDETHFNRPTDMAIMPNGEIFVTDGYGNRRVVHLDKNGKFIKAWGEYGSGPGEFILPHAIVYDSKGRLYVADRNSGRIQVFKQDGSFVDQWTGLIMPWGLHVAEGDEIWVAGSSPHWWRRHNKYQEYKDQMFMCFSTDGRARLIWTFPLGDPENKKTGETVGAHCLVKDKDGNIYVGDIYTERAQKFVPVTSRPTAPKK
ncbi:MAG: peptidyl-alpha-hydroxyglycine alpha-amidating lyase family protein [Limisphaerales bacterium]